MNSNLSKILPQIGKRETGLQLTMICLSPFLWTRIILDFFQITGKMALSIQFLNIIDKGLTIDWPQSFIILTKISLWPWALVTFGDLMIFNISTLLKLIEESLAVEI